VADVNEDSVQLRQTPEFTKKDKRLTALAASFGPRRGRFRHL